MGIDEGAMLRIANHGLPGDKPKIPQGDLYVSVFSQPDKQFQRQGADLWHTVKINVADAVLGAEITVPTLGKNVQVKIPAGTQPDEVLRLRGKGLPRFDGTDRGDLKLRIQATIPTHLTDDQKRLYEQLRSLN